MLHMLWLAWVGCGVCYGLYGAAMAFVDVAADVYLWLKGE